MKFLVAFLLTVLLSFITSLQFEWWVIAVVAFIVAALVLQKPWKAFLAGFAGIFVLWAVLAQWMDSENGSILSRKIAMLLGIGSNSSLLVFITGLVGGLVGGFAALSGSYLRQKKVVVEPLQ